MSGVFICGECRSTVFEPAKGGGCPCCGYRTPKVVTKVQENFSPSKQKLVDGSHERMLCPLCCVPFQVQEDGRLGCSSCSIVLHSTLTLSTDETGRITGIEDEDTRSEPKSEYTPSIAAQISAENQERRRQGNAIEGTHYGEQRISNRRDCPACGGTSDTCSTCFDFRGDPMG